MKHLHLPESSSSQMICPRSPLLISGFGLLNPHSGLLTPAASPLLVEQSTIRVIVNLFQNSPALSRPVMSIPAVHPTLKTFVATSYAETTNSDPKDVDEWNF